MALFQVVWEYNALVMNDIQLVVPARWLSFMTRAVYFHTTLSAIQYYINIGIFLVYQYCPKMWYLHSLESACVRKKLKTLDHKNGLVLSKTPVQYLGPKVHFFPEKFAMAVYRIIY